VTDHQAPGAASDDTSQPDRSRRKRVVLSDGSGPVTVLRTMTDLEEQSSMGTALVRGLIRAQLRAATGLAALTAAFLAGIPLLAYLVPAFSRGSVLGVPLPWLVIGVLPFPLLFLVGYAFNRVAERNEREFVTMAES
jgi:fatty acid desaturase